MNHWVKSIIGLAFLGLMLIFGWYQTRAPQALADSDLDYAAIEQHVQRIAEKPHPLGSKANHEVRDYIIGYFQSLGLETSLQQATVVYRHPTRSNQNTIIAYTENIIARLPGSLSWQTGVKDDLVVMSHYDSRPLTPGAADAASATAAIMEVARLMVSDPKPKHDVVFLITDGEEMGLLGAQAFFRQHAAAAEVGLVLNFEARGSTAASTMFETSQNNAWLIEQLIDYAPDLVAGSLSYEIYRRMPNDTDMSISKGEGIAGLNFGFVGGLFDYHAMTDTVYNLDKKSLAQQANYILSGARHFAHLESWQEGQADMSYFNVVRGVLVSYSQSFAVLSGIAVLVFSFGVMLLAVRRSRLSISVIGTGLMAAVVMVIFISNVFESMIDFQQDRVDGIAQLIALGEWPLLAYFVTTLGLCGCFCTLFSRGFSKAMAWILPVILAGLSLLAGRGWQGALIAIVLLVPALLFLRKRQKAPDLWAAGIVLWWIMTALVLYFAPNAAYLFVWPLLVISLGFYWHHRQNAEEGLPRLSLTIAASFIPLLLLIPMVVMAYLALGSSLPQMIMIISTLTLLLVWPLLQNISTVRYRTPSLLLTGFGALAVMMMLFGTAFDQRHPKEEALFLATDLDQQRQFWVSEDARPGSWAAAVLGEQAKTMNMSEILPGYEQEVSYTQVPFEMVEAAFVRIKEDRVIDGQRRMRLHIESPRGSEYINLLLPEDLNFTAASVNGHDIAVPLTRQAAGTDTDRISADKNRDKGEADNWWRWRWYGLPESGAEIVLSFDPDSNLRLNLVEIDYGLPEAVEPRPGGIMARKYTWSDSHVLYRTQEFD